MKELLYSEKIPCNYTKRAATEIGRDYLRILTEECNLQTCALCQGRLEALALPDLSHWSNTRLILDATLFR